MSYAPKSKQRIKIKKNHSFKKESRKPKTSFIRAKKPAIHKRKIEIDSSMIMLLIEYFLKSRLITKEELETLTLNKDNPLREVEVKINNQVLGKNQVRDLWLLQMRNHNLFCSICGNPINSADSSHHNPWRLTAEHRIPKSKGGKTDSTNLDPSHSICNSLKSNMMPDQWERLGLSILQSRGIPVDFNKTIFNYLQQNRRQK